MKILILLLFLLTACSNEPVLDECYTCVQTIERSTVPYTNPCATVTYDMICDISPAQLDSIIRAGSGIFDDTMNGLKITIKKIKYCYK